MIYVFYEKLPFYDLSSHKHKFIKAVPTKRAGKDGDHILCNGEYIFTNSYVDLLVKDDNPQHVFLSSDTTKSTITANTGVKADEVEIMM